MEYRDLNGNGALDPYEDPRRPIEERVEDLLAQMTLEEKAGLMYHTPIGIEPGRHAARGARAVRAGARRPSSSLERHINHFNIYWTPGAARDRRVAQPPAEARRGGRGSGSR